MFRVFSKNSKKKKKAQKKHTVGEKKQKKRDDYLLALTHTHRRTEHDARERALTARRE